MLASNVVKYLDRHDLMYDLQHRLREKRSYETQLIMFIEEFARNAIVCKQTDIILLHFAKSFQQSQPQQTHMETA